MSRKRYCFAPGCNTGYSHNNRNVSLFKVPKNQLDQWQAVTPHPEYKNLTNNDVLCEKHFRKRDIVREVVTATYRYPLKTPRLRQNAKPSIWPNCPSHLLSALSLPKEPPEDEAPSEEPFEEPKTTWTRMLDEDKKPYLYKMHTKPGATQVDEVVLDEDTKPHPHHTDAEATEAEDDPLQSWLHHLFNRLSKTDVTLPSESWTVKCHPNIIAIFETAPIEDDIVITKKIVVSKSSMNFSIFQHVHERLTAESGKKFDSLADFEISIADFDQLDICYGLKVHSDMLTMDFGRLTRYHQDEYSKCVRHKNCQYIRGRVPNKCSFKYVKCCALCRNAKKALRHLKKSMAKTETRTTVFRKNVINCRRRERRLQLRLDRVKEKLQEVTATNGSGVADQLVVNVTSDIEEMSDESDRSDEETVDVKEELLNVDKLKEEP